MNQIINIDCLEGLKALPDQSVNCCVTSPPYWGLRDYGVIGQIGLEITPDEYVAKMVEVFREVKRVLRDDGTLWLNLGDSYCASPPGHKSSWSTSGLHGAKTSKKYQETLNKSVMTVKNKTFPGLKPKDLVGIPWRVAFALQVDGWYLRSDIIWHKPNPMPESVKDRPTKAHEYIFLMSKSERYHYDIDAIREEHAADGRKPGNKSRIFLDRNPKYHTEEKRCRGEEQSFHPKGRNKRTVWTVALKPFRDAHFATFPPDLIRPCILAGCPENGIVLDPFMGAGTTAITALELGRNYIGFELNKSYCEIAERRIDKVRQQINLCV